MTHTRMAMATLADEITSISGGRPSRAFRWSARNPHTRYKNRQTDAVLIVFDEDGSAMYVTGDEVYQVDLDGTVQGEVVMRNGKPTFSAAALPMR